MIATVALYLVAAALLPCSTVSFTSYSRRQTTHMSVESCNNEKSIAEFSKHDLNRILTATASAMSVFTISSAANAYGNRLESMSCDSGNNNVYRKQSFHFQFVNIFFVATGAVSDQVKTKKTAKSAPKVLETELGIKYIELKKGSGAFPTANDYVIINYR